MNNTDIKGAILDKIKAYNKIIISRHIRPDGDATGSSKGLCEMLKLTFPEKEIYLINEDYSEYMAFLGNEDTQLEDEQYNDALIIVLDTATADRISNKKYGLAKELIKIDHHINIKPYGDLCWIEEQRSSVCEMIADFYITFGNELKLNKTAATYIYTGMVTDSGRFKYSSASGDTMRCAAAMLDFGIDTETLFAHLYLSDFSYLKFQSYALDKMRITEHGVAYLYISRKTQERLALTPEQASASVSFLDSIKGSIIWLAFIENTDSSIRVRLRSRFVTVNELAERYHGGGHANASGATVCNKKEMRALLSDADRLISTYKDNNNGWL